MGDLTHFNAEGDAHMVNVGEKSETHRVAIAEGWISMQPETLALVESGGHAKGDVLGIARLAGIMGAKKTADLVPLCHPLPLSHVDVKLEVHAERSAIRCEVRAETVGRTGVEMEALTATQVCLLTIYDMCKAVDRGMSMDRIALLSKSGGRSGDWRRGAD